MGTSLFLVKQFPIVRKSQMPYIFMKFEGRKKENACILYVAHTVTGE